MLRNYLKTSIRNFFRHKVYSLINILGLTVGLAASIMIFLWITDELSYDRFHADGDRMYSVLINYTYSDGKIDTHGANPSKLKGVIESEIPEVEVATQYDMGVELLVKYGDNGFEERGFHADPNFFKVFDFPIIEGSVDKPINGLSSIAISERLAQKLFKDEDPIGKTVNIGQQHDMVVSSVFADIPSNSTMKFDYVLPFEKFTKENPWT